MPTPSSSFDLEELVIATYTALDDSLAVAGLICQDGKLIPRAGPKPEVDDREILCLAVLQELLGFESDNEFHAWFKGNVTIKKLFPRQLSRQNFADRRALLTPLIASLCGAFCVMDDEAAPPFQPSILTPSTSVAPFVPEKKNAWADWHDEATAPRLSAGFTACANI
jgi:hypothetical protein